MSVKKYKCDDCGACCTQLIVEVSIIDVLREPKLRQLQPFKAPPDAGEINDDTVPKGWTDPFLHGAMLMAGKTKPCPFHTGHSCGIYPTRPEECVGFLPGSPKCQEVRKMVGLKPLAPIK
jgi:Fe-S-cluster containining protein